MTEQHITSSLLTLVFASACGTTAPETDAFPIPLVNDCVVSLPGDVYIGALYPVEFLVSTDPAIMLAVSEVNNQGGIDGLQLGVVTCDSDPFGGQAAADNAIQELVAIDEIAGIVGPGFSSVSLRVSPVAQASEKVMVATFATASQLSTLDDDGYFFRTVVSDSMEATVAAAIARADGHETAFIVHADDAWGQGLEQNFTESFGVADVSSYGYDEDDANFAQTAFEAIEAAQPDVVMLFAYDLDAVAIARQAVAMESTFKPNWILGTTSDEFLNDTGSREYWVGSKGMRVIRSGVGPDALDAAWEAAYGTEALGDRNKGFAYDATMLIALGMLLSDDPTDGMQLRDNLAHTSSGTEVVPGQWANALAHKDEGTFQYLGGSGPVDFDENGDVSGEFRELTISSSLSFGFAERCWTGAGQEMPCSD